MISTKPMTTSVPRCPAVALVEHGVGLAHTCRGSEVDAEVAGCLDRVVTASSEVTDGCLAAGLGWGHRHTVIQSRPIGSPRQNITEAGETEAPGGAEGSAGWRARLRSGE